MAVELQLNTPLADSIQNAVQPKLVEMGWSTDGTDGLVEYIMLMLVNGKTQDEIATEMVVLLDIGAGTDDPGVKQFVPWLFEQVQILGGQGSTSQSGGQPSVEEGVGAEPTADAEMGGVAEGQSNGAIPKGPRGMRNGVSTQPRDKRTLGQLNKAMNRTGEAGLHRVRDATGTGRINSHSREPPKGPRGANGRPRQGVRPPNGPMAMNPMQQNPQFGSMTPQQQMQLFAMYEEQARMMAQILSPQQQQQMFGQVNPATQNGFGSAQQGGKSLFDRVESKPQRQNGHFNKRQHQQHPINSVQSNAADMAEPTSSMEVETSSQTSPTNPATTVCRFNLTCTNPTCPYAHQSPSAPPGTPIDIADTCTFGAACKNRKCSANHPSPAQRTVHNSEVDCKYWPHCTNPACPFRHPTNAEGRQAPPCRNGADCTTPGCKFSHSAVTCKFDPCLNPACGYKHTPGQKRGKFHDKVWVNREGDNDPEQEQHVSQRKFVADDEGLEELILPGRDGGSDAANANALDAAGQQTQNMQHQSTETAAT